MDRISDFRWYRNEILEAPIIMLLTVEVILMALQMLWRIKRPWACVLRSGHGGPLDWLK